METREYEMMYRVEDTHFWYKGMRKITKTLLDKYLPKSKRLKILDAGCGTGRNIIFLKNYGQVSGFDISPHAIKYCKKRKLANIKLGDINRINFKDGSFDVVTCFDVLYHKQVKNYKNVISNFLRILKPGGILFIRVPAFQFLLSSHDKAVHTKHRFNKNELKEILISRQFKILKISYINFFLFPFIAVSRMINKSKSSDVKKINFLLNYLLQFPLWIESLMISYISFPYGVSLVAICQKK